MKLGADSTHEHLTHLRGPGKEQPTESFERLTQVRDLETLRNLGDHLGLDRDLDSTGTRPGHRHRTPAIGPHRHRVWAGGYTGEPRFARGGGLAADDEPPSVEQNKL